MIGGMIQHTQHSAMLYSEVHTVRTSDFSISVARLPMRALTSGCLESMPCRPLRVMLSPLELNTPTVQCSVVQCSVVWCVSKGVMQDRTEQSRPGVGDGV